MIDFVKKDPSNKFIVATEAGILHKMKQEVPEKILIRHLPMKTTLALAANAVTSKMNTLQKVYDCLLNETPEITVPYVHHQKRIGSYRTNGRIIQVMIQTNYLIIGSGVAGLTFAVKIAERFPDKKVTIVTKANENESNTRYAQGGIAIVTDIIGDSYDKHIQDTLICGDGLCDESVVEMVITEGPKRLKELIEWGAKFDKNTQGTLDLGKEGGHSENRVVHHKDQTGQEIQRAILSQVHQKENITVLDYHLAIDLITENNICLGAYVLDQKQRKYSLFNPILPYWPWRNWAFVWSHHQSVIATGDGIAIGFESECRYQGNGIHPVSPHRFIRRFDRNFVLISEAVRGFGVICVPKTAIALCPIMIPGAIWLRATLFRKASIWNEKTGDECVYLRLYPFGFGGFKKHFPMIYDRCKRVGIDIAKYWIPVVPAEHYLCGGIVVDKNGKTSVENLFACGECSRNRIAWCESLASNSLLEALVYSDKIYHYLADTSLEKNPSIGSVSDWKVTAKPEINRIMWPKPKPSYNFRCVRMPESCAMMPI